VRKTIDRRVKVFIPYHPQHHVHHHHQDKTDGGEVGVDALGSLGDVFLSSIATAKVVMP